MPTIITKDLIKYSSFIFACFLVVWIFFTATTLIQLAAGILIYPLFVLFAYKIFLHKMRRYPSQRPAAAIKPVKLVEGAGQSQGAKVGIADIDKRVFLKLIGGTGLTVFLLSLFSKKTEDIFFKNLPSRDAVSLMDVEGRKITPAQESPLDGYNIVEIEDETISFYGFSNAKGEWYILRLDTDLGSVRYARGDRNFPGAWKDREKLEYGYFSDIFKN